MTIHMVSLCWLSFTTANRVDSSDLHIHVETEPMNAVPTRNNDNWHTIEVSSTDVSTADSSAHDSFSIKASNDEDGLMPELAPMGLPSPGDTHPNTPVGDYHIIYSCDTHGKQNHYGPYCGCSPSILSINMPPWLADGLWPSILPDRSTFLGRLELQLPLLLWRFWRSHLLITMQQLERWPKLGLLLLKDRLDLGWGVNFLSSRCHRAGQNVLCCLLWYEHWYL